ncbi:vacuolar protein sorting-associated protein 33B [Orussus abietinus]|uniref:vacuolar protein sorting-associated protein 33B n=1 Tax=Orussus abietinus TaxID=222816 RepID=UPI0006262F0C|nr:vacuolar protein sorting-associated protein 33B [Orussus abietinus]XP_012288657.1 vacuolar protein sorting-associated protein 33B [Orussus abietinus]XP_012288658.1 vacuolar protein sorting-associated protein 33B [Orussus abietinus]XP_023288181.1 vacuolar protein sorting-associated protein 33B [Orussus abietinus]
MDPSLSDKLDALQQISQRKLVEILNSIPGKKDLIIESKLMKPLDCFVGVTVLRKYDVDKIFKMEQGLKPVNTQRVFLVSCNLISCKRVLDQVQSELPQSHGVSHHLIIVPYIPVVLHTLIEEEGLTGLLTVRRLSWEFLRSDGNILSLEVPMFTDLYYHKDSSFLPVIARSLWSLKLVLGSPKLSISFGKYSQQVLSMVDTMEESWGSADEDNQLGALIVMDRSFDLATVLLTPVTYSGLMNEILDINAGTAYLNNSLSKLDPKKDQIYGELRDRHFSDIFQTLREKTRSLKSEQEATQRMKLADMQRYVANELQKTTEVKRQLAFHIAACEAIVDALGSEFEDLQLIEESILECRKWKECLEYIERNIDDHPMRSLRLISLLSIASDGSTESELRQIQKSHLHAHGYEHIPLFHKMETAGLLRYKPENILNKLPSRNSDWAANAQRLKLLPNRAKQLDLKVPTCPSYVFNGVYIPAIAQILNIVLRQDMDTKTFDDMGNLPGCSVTGYRGQIQPRTVVVYIIGGISYAEIAACRLIEASTGSRIALASDSIITGDKLFQSLQDA